MGHSEWTQPMGLNEYISMVRTFGKVSKNPKFERSSLHSFLVTAVWNLGLVKQK